MADNDNIFKKTVAVYYGDPKHSPFFYEAMLRIAKAARVNLIKYSADINEGMAVKDSDPKKSKDLLETAEMYKSRLDDFFDTRCFADLVIETAYHIWCMSPLEVHSLPDLNLDPGIEQFKAQFFRNAINDKVPSCICEEDSIVTNAYGGKLGPDRVCTLSLTFKGNAVSIKSNQELR